MNPSLDLEQAELGSHRLQLRPPDPERVILPAMHAMKAHVKNGRLVLDEPTDLPDGEVVYLQLVDGIVAASDDDMDADDRAALHEELDASLAEADAGQTEDFGKMISELRSRL